MSASDTANMIVAATSITAILVAVGTYWLQNRQAHRLLGIQILRDFEEIFYRSEHTRELRHAVCSYFKRNGLQAETPPEAWRLADELGAISFYINEGYVDLKAAWAILYYWLDNYWFLLNGYADDLKKECNGVDYLLDFRMAHSRLTDFGKKFHGLSDDRNSPDAIQQFLDYELAETSYSLDRASRRGTSA